MTTNHATNQNVREQFGAVAEAYARSSYHSSGPDLAALVAAARPIGNEQVLDLGAGAGHMALAMAKHVANVVGIDLTPEMVGVATSLANERGIANATFRQADVVALPFADASFDIVTSRVSAHHYADPQRALGEAFRVLRPGGSFFLIDTVSPEDPALDTYFNCFELLRDSSHVRNWRGSEWLRMLAAAGFSARMLERFAVSQDGQDWVNRMKTPPEKVVVLRKLFSEATQAQRDAFELAEGPPWRLSVPIAFFQADKPPS
jgi:ubiquinone/menaquinone biosynthesis C-methylase UbiE